jgi:hypothetical protein
MEKPIPYRNRSPYGWWVAIYLIRAAWDDQEPLGDEDQCVAWENTIILQAPDRESAYKKALAMAQVDGGEFSDEANPERKGRWVLEGLMSLLAIHDELTDGAEILWTEHSTVPIGRLRSWIKTKHELEAFDDSPGPCDG